MHHQISPFAAAATVLSVLFAANIFDILLVVVVGVGQGEEPLPISKEMSAGLSLSQKSAQGPERNGPV